MVGLRSSHVLEEFSDRYTEQLAELVHRLDVDARRCLVVEKRDCVSVQPGHPGDIDHLELALAHQAREMTTNHFTQKTQKTS